MSKKNAKNQQRHNQKRQQKQAGRKKCNERPRPISKDELHEDLEAMIAKTQEDM